MKKISIILPVYNAVSFIDQCMASLTSQTIGVDALELIAVNDASTDDSFNKLMEWEACFPQSVMVINCEKNGKQGAARNIGLSYASADYVSFVDIDDWVEADCYEKMYKMAKKYDCDAVAAGYREECSRLSSPMGENKAGDQFYIIETDEDRGGFFGVDFGQGILGNLYRKSMLLENNISFLENIFYEDDYWFVLTMNYIRRAYIIGEDFYHYYLHMESTIHKRNSPHQLDRAAVEKMKLMELLKRGIFARFPTLYEHEFIQHYYMHMLYVLFTQFDILNYDMVKQLHDDTLAIFPNYRNNPFIQRILDGKGGSYMREVYESLALATLGTNDIDALKKLCLKDDGHWIEIRI